MAGQREFSITVDNFTVRTDGLTGRQNAALKKRLHCIRHVDSTIGRIDDESDEVQTAEIELYVKQGRQAGDVLRAIEAEVTRAYRLAK